MKSITDIVDYLNTLGIFELRELALKFDIKNPTTFTKADLINKINNCLLDDSSECCLTRLVKFIND